MHAELKNRGNHVHNQRFSLKLGYQEWLRQKQFPVILNRVSGHY